MALERRRSPVDVAFRSLREQMEDMERWMEESFGLPMLRRWRRRYPAEEMPWAPMVEMYEKADHFVVRAEVPGVMEQDLDISVTGEFLTVKGERKAPSDVKDEEYCVCEVAYGPFSRTIALPMAVDAEKISAKFENGLLELHVPKAAGAVPKKIEIKAK